MDTDKLRAATDAARIESRGWRSAEFRRKIVDKMSPMICRWTGPDDFLFYCSVLFLNSSFSVNTIFENGPHSWTYKTSNVTNFAEKFEEKVFASATDEADYIAKVSRRLMIIKGSSQSSRQKLLPVNSSDLKEVKAAPGAEESAKNIDWQEPLYQRLQSMKSRYFSRITIVYNHVTCKLQQRDSASQKMKFDLEKYRFIKKLLEEAFTYFNFTKSQIPPDFKERLDEMERYINSILRPKNVSSHNEGPHSADVHSMHQALPSQARFSQEKLTEEKQTLPTMTLQSSHLTKLMPQQNMMTHLQEKSTNSEQHKSNKSMQQMAKESSNSQRHENQLSQIKGVTSKHSFENFPISSTGNATQQQTDGTQQSDESYLIGTPGISSSPLLEGCNNLNEGSHNPTVNSDEPSPAMQRLLKVMKSMSPTSLSESINEIRDVVQLSDLSSAPFRGPKDVIGSNMVEDLSADARARYSSSGGFLPREQKMRRCGNAMTLYTAATHVTTTDLIKPLTDADKPDLNSITSQTDWPMIEENYALLEEIKKVNKSLMDTEVLLNEEDTIPSVAAAAAKHGEGLIVKCFFRAVTVNLNQAPHFVSNQMPIINPLWLLVPTSYPTCSPILLDEMPLELSQDPYNLSMKANLKLQTCLRNLTHPWSLGDVAKLWDKCAREAICDYAQKLGGGTFTSKYGGWETCSSVD
ncbi:mediator of RNA polymerase II transcription subunit 15a-like [Senna tora]|uniref:Mediator of RNA polymerase II transcription subunit 15a-like n=1 Tax=Senna tora TaxID=362788 RepID=A0A834TQM0_9FABA|nr:mediator of RNA polymerase II transcription subunit 15a-like [Senna tora]